MNLKNIKSHALLKRCLLFTWILPLVFILVNEWSEQARWAIFGGRHGRYLSNPHIYTYLVCVSVLFKYKSWVKNLFIGLRVGIIISYKVFIDVTPELSDSLFIIHLLVLLIGETIIYLYSYYKDYKRNIPLIILGFILAIILSFPISIFVNFDRALKRSNESMFVH